LQDNIAGWDDHNRWQNYSKYDVVGPMAAVSRAENKAWNDQGADGCEKYDPEPLHQTLIWLLGAIPE
jgi:hypothetical protein